MRSIHLQLPTFDREALVNPTDQKLRVVLFGSYYRGFHVLNELLFGPESSGIVVVGVATDDPESTFISRHKRVWQYPHTPEETRMVRQLAQSQGIPVYSERVKTPEFYALIEDEWQPDYCIMATFGQRIDTRLFSYPVDGFYNLHPSDNGIWPSRYAGGNPFSALLEDGAAHCVVTLHRVNEGIDTGERLMVSDPLFIPPGATVTDLHKASSPLAAQLVRRHVRQLLNERSTPVHGVKAYAAR